MIQGLEGHSGWPTWAHANMKPSPLARTKSLLSFEAKTSKANMPRNFTEWSRFGVIVRGPGYHLPLPTSTRLPEASEPFQALNEEKSSYMFASESAVTVV